MGPNIFRCGSRALRRWHRPAGRCPPGWALTSTKGRRAYARPGSRRRRASRAAPWAAAGTRSAERRLHYVLVLSYVYNGGSSTVPGARGCLGSFLGALSWRPPRPTQRWEIFAGIFAQREADASQVTQVTQVSQAVVKVCFWGARAGDGSRPGWGLHVARNTALSGNVKSHEK